jgi:hypothetical protein
VRTGIAFLAGSLLTGGAAAVDAGPAAPPERDRGAILALAGTYRVTFDFRETLPIEPGYELRPQYTSTAPVEWVEVIVNEPRLISIQHVLVLDDEVVKHWRQDWLYESQDLYDFAGNNTWKHRKLSPEEARGTWTQRVFQVDDSPRYQSHGRWVHRDGMSTWESAEWAWRPLPRREMKKRDDYDSLVSRTRYTLTPKGFTLEQDSYKLALRASGPVVLVREAGLETYERVDAEKAEKAREYWSRTRDFWAIVRASWDGVLVPGANVQVAREVEGKRLGERIDGLAVGPRESEEATKEEVRAVLRAYVRAPQTQAAAPKEPQAAAR